MIKYHPVTGEVVEYLSDKESDYHRSIRGIVNVPGQKINSLSEEESKEELKREAEHQAQESKDLIEKWKSSNIRAYKKFDEIFFTRDGSDFVLAVPVHYKQKMPRHFTCNGSLEQFTWQIVNLFLEEGDILTTVGKMLDALENYNPDSVHAVLLDRERKVFWSDMKKETVLNGKGARVDEFLTQINAIPFENSLANGEERKLSSPESTEDEALLSTESVRNKEAEKIAENSMVYGGHGEVTTTTRAVAWIITVLLPVLLYMLGDVGVIIGGTVFIALIGDLMLKAAGAGARLGFGFLGNLILR